MKDDRTPLQKKADRLENKLVDMYFRAWGEDDEAEPEEFMRFKDTLKKYRDAVEAAYGNIHGSWD